MKYFYGSFLFTAVCLALAAWLGWSSTHSLWGAAGVLWIVVVLGILEISLSFDNAVVDASVLRTMDPVWQRRFLTWGGAIAVFGMRILFPLLIVSVAARLGPIDTLHLAVTQPEAYQRIITGAHLGIAGFGGAFLAMVGFKFFFDADKDVHWIAVVERWFQRLSSVAAIEIGAVLLLLYAIATFLPPDERWTFLTTGLFGILTYIGVEALGTFLEAPQMAGGVARGGLGAFLYLEVIDASFSFDGAIGAFALSNNIFIIALGLGIGAIFVRSMTVMLVKKGTLEQFRYLEHGAFWAIVALALIMLTSACIHIPETVTGLIGAVFIGLSLVGSVRYRRREIGEKG